ncbi:unnamed protein product [Closterium sp. NIES-54]
MKDSWSLEWIRAQVLQEEFRRKELTAAAGEGGGSAYGMKGFKGRSSKKGKAKEGSGGEQYSGGKCSNKGGKRCGGKCWYCHVEGHPWFKCRKLPDGWRPRQPSIEGSNGVHGAMGEGMGSEEGDGDAGGHGGMFYHFPDAVELPRWHDLLLQNVPIFDFDFDAILAAMYAIADSAEGDCYLRVPADPGIAATALGASAAAALGASASAAPGTGASAAPGTGASAAPGVCASALSGTTPIESFHTFTLDSSASRSFFWDSTTLTPLSRPVVVSVADPSGGPVYAHSSTVLPCPAAPSGVLSGLHLPSFSTNLVSGADLQDAWVVLTSKS